LVHYILAAQHGERKVDTVGIEGLLTVREVAKLLRVCTATVYKWVASGILPHIRIMNVIRVRPIALRLLLTERTRC
jgi:excisionase family DNA binding protein